MARRAGRSTLAEIHRALQQCHDLLDDMLAAQRRHCEGKRHANEPKRIKGLRKFTEAHFAFLNAAYSAGEYAKQSVAREHQDAVKALLTEPNIRFHRELRNAVDHVSRLDYTVSFNFQQTLALKTPATFPHPDLRIAMIRGFVEVENGPALIGKGFMTYDAARLNADDAGRLRHAMQELQLPENPPVIYMAERCYGRLASFTSQSERAGWFGSDLSA